MSKHTLYPNELQQLLKGVFDRSTLPQCKEAGKTEISPFIEQVTLMRDKLQKRNSQRRFAPKYVSDCFIVNYTEPTLRNASIVSETVWADGPLGCVSLKLEK